MIKWPERYKNIVLAWLDEQLKCPTRTEYYLMRIAQRVHAQWSKQGIQLDDELIPDLSTRLKYRKYMSKQRVSQQSAVERSKAIWHSADKMAQQSNRTKKHGH